MASQRALTSTGIPLRSLAALAVVGGLVALMTTAASPATSPVARCVGADAVASGVVTRNGEPAAGVEAVAEVWPDEEVLSSLADGDPVPIVVAATAVTAADGWFALSVDPGSLDPDYLGPDGYADITLVVTDGEQQTEWSFSAHLVQKPGFGSVWANPRVDRDLAAASSATDQASTHVLIDIGADVSVREDSSQPAECS